MEVPQGHEAALMRPPTAQQNKPPANARPWPRGVGGGPSSSAPSPPPPKVYRVEPREFRDLVQKLTGAPPPTGLRRHQHQHRAVVAPPPVQPQPVRAAEQQAYVAAAAAAPWFSFPMSGGAVEAQPHSQHGAFL